MEENKQQEAPKEEAPKQEQQPPVEKKAESSDVDKNKLMAIIGYVLPILFFVPLLSEESKHSPFAKFHANQQLVLLISAVIVNIAGSIIPFIGWFIILPFGGLAILVIAIIGLINAIKGEMKKLPIIGGFEILK